MQVAQSKVIPCTVGPCSAQLFTHPYIIFKHATQQTTHSFIFSQTKMNLAPGFAKISGLLCTPCVFVEEDVGERMQDSLASVNHHPLPRKTEGVHKRMRAFETIEHGGPGRSLEVSSY